MVSWKSLLNENPIEWLLEEENPSVRYYTLTDILGKTDRSSDVKKAKSAIMKNDIVVNILSKQKPGGYWGRKEDFYMRSKYKGTVWSFIVLAELGVDGNNKKIKSVCEFILKWSQDRESGGFAYIGSEKNGGQHSNVIPCLTGNMVWSMIRFGYLNDPRVKKGLEWLTAYQRFDDGDGKPPSEWPYKRYPQCWGAHTCSICVIKAMKAISEIPNSKRTKPMKSLIENGAKYFLKHHIHHRSHDLSKVAKPIWLKFGFPLFWQTDALDILGILIKLGYRDKRMKKAVDLILSKQDENGRWNLDHTYNDRMLVKIERKGKPSKWITLNALRALKGYYNLGSL